MLRPVADDDQTGPERPSERGAGPERPFERESGPKRPSERGAGPTEPPAPALGPPSATRPQKTEPLARLALGLAVAAVVLPPGAAAIAALAAASRARRRIAASPTPLEGRRAVALARVLSVLALVGWTTVLAVVIVGLETDDQGVDYADLRVGDCINVPDGAEIAALERLACSEPHDAEVFGVLAHPAEEGAPYPGSDTLVAFAGEACLGQVFTDYVGVPRDRSQLKHFEIVPQQSAWDDGRRQLVCAVDADAPLMGSIRGSGR